MKKDVCIIGAGLVGSLLAIYLRKQGYSVRIYERRGDMRKEKMSAGRSINLALSDRGIKALEEVGIIEEIKKIAIPMHGRFLHNADGTTAYQPYGQEGQYINSVSRSELNMKLMDLAERSGAEISFNHKCERIDFQGDTVYFENGHHAKTDLLFGTDGAYSSARLTHQLQHDRFQYEQFYIDYGYKELNIPPGEGGSFRLEKNALHIWPRGKYMMIALPNIDGSFTCTLFFPFEGIPSFQTLETPSEVNEFFKKEFADAYPLMPELEHDFFNNPTSSLVTVKCYPWIREDKFALIGDAAHAIVPFFGQGMNCGFEDCSVLNDLINKNEHNWKNILQEFQELRKPDADAIADLALNNFVEMRDKVADPMFLLQKKIEMNFNKKYPEKWIPSYSQVTFSPHIRYSEALKNSRAQQDIMDQIMSIPGISTKWDTEEIENKILERLNKN